MTDIRDDAPLELFQSWLAEATESEPNDPTAMTVATADADGMPSARMVLLKDADERGFVFYTNTESQKGCELDENPRAALVFHWKTLRRQVRVSGAVERTSDAEADAYFASRARGSQIGAWASQQSQPVESRDVLEAQVAALEAQYDDIDIPRPPYWSGFLVVPDRIEFWTDRRDRLHDRQVFLRDGANWREERLQP